MRGGGLRSAFGMWKTPLVWYGIQWKVEKIMHRHEYSLRVCDALTVPQHSLVEVLRHLGSVLRGLEIGDSFRTAVANCCAVVSPAETVREIHVSICEWAAEFHHQPDCWRRIGVGLSTRSSMHSI